jgi:PBP1b-binding outer membrane lipoprotein LpoB
MNYTKTGIARAGLELVLAVFAVMFAGCAGSPPASSSSNTQTAEINREMVPQPNDIETLVAPAEFDNSAEFTKANFDRIKNGMSLSDVENIILGSGIPVSSETVKGKLNEVYSWNSADSTKSIEVKFIESKVVSKSQKGLR